MPPPSGGLSWTSEGGLASSSQRGSINGSSGMMSEEEQMKWALQESMKSMAASSSLEERQPPISPIGIGRRSPQENHQVSRVVNDAVTKPQKRQRQPSVEIISSSPPPLLVKPPKERLEKTEQERLADLASALSAADHPATDFARLDSWTCQVCTCINPLQFLACEACGVERPPTAVRKPVPRKPIPPKPSGWSCRECGTFMEHKWWTCSGCGLMKESSTG